MKSYKYNRYIVAGRNGAINANRTSRKCWETFNVQTMGRPNTIALRSIHRMYLTAERDGDIIANRKEAKGWETFSIESVGDNTIALKTAHGKYIASKEDGQIIADSNGPGDEGIWTYDCVKGKIAN